MKYLLLIFLLFIKIGYCQLVITSIDATYGTHYDQQNADYLITWQYIEKPGDNDVIDPQNASGYQFSVFHLHNNQVYNVAAFHGYYPGVKQCHTGSAVNGKTTWKQVESEFISYSGGGNTGTCVTGHTGQLDGMRECVAFGAGLGTSSSRLLTNGPLTCLVAPPSPDPHCDILDNILLDFGTVSTGEESGKIARFNATLQCELSATVKLNDARSDGGVVDFGWGKVHTTINDLSLEDNPIIINANAGGNPLKFEAKIEGVNAPPGDYNGSYPLTIEYQ